MVFVMASVLAAISGILVGPIVTVQPHMGLVFTVKALAVAALGALPIRSACWPARSFSGGGKLLELFQLGVWRPLSTADRADTGGRKPSGLFGRRRPMSAEPVRLPHRRPYCVVGAFRLAAVVVVGFPLVVTNKFYIHLAQTLCYTTVAVVGLNILLGLSGQMSLGQAGVLRRRRLRLGAVCRRSWAGRSPSRCWPASRSPAYSASPSDSSRCARAACTSPWRHSCSASLPRSPCSVGPISPAARWVCSASEPGLRLAQDGRRIFLWVAGAVYLAVQILSDYVFASRYYRILRRSRKTSTARTAGLNVPVWRTAVFALSAVAAGTAGVLLHASERLHQ